MYRIFFKSFLAISGLVAVSAQAQAVEVYLFKGAGDLSFINKKMHFSGGLQQLTDQLNSEGIHAELRRYGAVDDAISTIRRRKPDSVAFIGHSMGALASLGMAKKMKSMGVRVAYIGLIDIPGPVGVAGDNVKWAENYYSTFPVYGMLTNAKSHPNAKNIHVSGQIHTTMDDSLVVRKGMLAALRQVHFSEQEQSIPSQNQQVAEPQLIANQNPEQDFTPSYTQNINLSGDMMRQSGVNQYETNNPAADQFPRPSVEVPVASMGVQQIDPTTTSSIMSDTFDVRGSSAPVKTRKHYTRQQHSASGR